MKQFTWPAKLDCKEAHSQIKTIQYSSEEEKCTPQHYHVQLQVLQRTKKKQEKGKRPSRPVFRPDNANQFQSKIQMWARAKPWKFLWMGFWNQYTHRQETCEWGDVYWKSEGNFTTWNRVQNIFYPKCNKIILKEFHSWIWLLYLEPQQSRFTKAISSNVHTN